MTGTLVASTINAGASASLLLQSNNTTALTLDTSQNVTAAGTVAMASSFKRNALINGNMQTWQRGTSAAGSYPTYLADRWMNYRSVAGSTFSRQSVNDTTNLPNFQYCQRLQRDSGNTSTAAIYNSQSIETVNSIPLVGGSVTVSFYARAGANFSAASSNMNLEVVYGTGTDQNVIAGFTGQTNSVATTKTLTTTWQRFTATGTVPSTATQLAVNLYFIPVGTAGAADYMEITGVQLEVGTKATPYEMQIYSDQLAQCQRYYQQIGGNSSVGAAAYSMMGSGIAISTTTADIMVPLLVSMRTAPTLNTSNTAIQVVSTNYAVTSFSSIGTTFNTVWIRTVTGGVFVAGYGAIFSANNNTAGYISMSAEL